MDFSNFPPEHPLHDNIHKKQIGYLKMENAEKYIQQFVGLKSKLYSVKYSDDSEKRTAKGLNKTVLNKYVNHEHYINVLEKNQMYIAKMNSIQSKEHQLKTVQLKKLIFTNFDDKRWISSDNINTLPYGHYSLT